VGTSTKRCFSPPQTRPSNIQPGSCPPRKRQDGLRGHINQTLLFPTTNKAIQHSAPKVFLKNTPPPPSTVLWAGFLIVWRTPRPYGAESVLEVLQGSVAESGETAFPTWGARPLMVAPSDIIFLTGFGDVRAPLQVSRVPWVPKRGVASFPSASQALYVGSDAGCCSSPMYCLASAEVRFGSVSRVPWVPERGVASFPSASQALYVGSDAGCCSSPMHCLASAEVRFGSVSRVPWVPTRGVAPPQCTAWFPKREPIGDEEHTAAEPLGKARGTQAEPKRNPRRVLVRRCFRVEEPKGGNRNPGRNPARLLVRLGLRGRAPLRGIYYYYRGGRAPQGATRRCAPALYRGPGPKRVASQSCQVVFRTCLNQTGSNST